MNEELLDDLTGRYKGLITCVAFMGGDSEPEEVAKWADYLKAGGLKTAWYSGRMNMPKDEKAFDYIKLGPYIESLGGLKSPTTNQRLYKRVGEKWEDITSSFWRKSSL